MTHVLAPLAPLLQWLVVMTHVLAPLAPLLQWLVVVMTHVLAPLPGVALIKSPKIIFAPTPFNFSGCPRYICR